VGVKSPPDRQSIPQNSTTRNFPDVFEGDFVTRETPSRSNTESTEFLVSHLVKVLAYVDGRGVRGGFWQLRNIYAHFFEYQLWDIDQSLASAFGQLIKDAIAEDFEYVSKTHKRQINSSGNPQGEAREFVVKVFQSDQQRINQFVSIYGDRIARAFEYTFKLQ
jgi:hypothetical protein